MFLPIKLENFLLSQGHKSFQKSIPFLFFVSRDIDNVEPMILGIVDCVSCPAIALGLIADAHTAPIHQVPVPSVHTTSSVGFPRVYDFVGPV